MILGPLPRRSPSVCHSRNFNLEKHNRRLGKVSHQMDRIIADIKGYGPKEVLSRREKSSKTDLQSNCTTIHLKKSGICRKTTERKDHSDQGYHKQRLQRKSRKQIENSRKQRELVVKQAKGQVELILPTLLTARRGNSTSSRSLSSDENCDYDNILSNDQGSSFKENRMPWNRPLPPIPGESTTGLHFQMNAKGDRRDVRPNSANSTKNCNVILPNYPKEGCDYMQDEHIYESISDVDGYKAIVEIDPERLFCDWSSSRSPSSVHRATPEFSPLSAFIPFSHDDTYLEPCSSSNEGQLNILSVNCSSFDHNGLYNDQVSDFPEYSRDCWSSPGSCTVSDESRWLKAIYV